MNARWPNPKIKRKQTPKFDSQVEQLCEWTMNSLNPMMDEIN